MRRKPVAYIYTPETVREAFAPYLTQLEPGETGEMRMFCPICEDPDLSRTPSASINPAGGVWSCRKSPEDHGGKISALALEIGVPISGTVNRTAALSKPKLLRALENQDNPYEWHTELMSGARPDFLDFLTKERGLRSETLQYFNIGADTQRITIPIKLHGEYINVRRYLPHAPGGTAKIFNLPGFGSPSVLAFTETLTNNPLPVVATEGELDAALLWQEGDGRLAVVTGTGGAATVPSDLSALRGREVFVAYDLDETGRNGAQKFAAAARKAGARGIYVLDLAQLGLKGEKADLSDYLLQGGSVEALLAEMERLRETPETSRERFKVVSAAELAEPLPPMRWLVQRVFPADSYGVLAGEKKTLKTYTGLAFALALASGEPFLGKFTVPEPQPVLVYSGEGGERPTRRRLQRLAQFMGVDLAKLPLRMVFDSGDITGREFLDAFERAISDEAPGLIIVDPLYAFHPPGVEAQNLYDRGAMLANIVQMVPEGASFLLADHFRKTGNKDLDLDSVAQAGVAQWADSWILQAHGSPARVDEGEFSLKVQFGSRQWGGAEYSVDWSLGRFDAAAGEHSGDLRVEVREAAWSMSQSRNTSEDVVRSHILLLLETEPLRHTATSAQKLVMKTTEVGAAKVRSAWKALVAEGLIESQSMEVPEGNRKVPRDLWKLAPAQDNRLKLTGGGPE